MQQQQVVLKQRRRHLLLLDVRMSGIKYGMKLLPLRRRRRLPTNLSDCVVEAHTGDNTSVHEYRTVLYYATIDTLLQDLNDRFSELNLSLLKSLQALVPNSGTFLKLSSLQPFLTHYSIDEEGISSELLTAPTVLWEVSPLTSMNQVYSHLNEVKECFPLLLEALQIAMTFGVTTATGERTFSSLRRLKTYLRSTMSQEQLNHLSLLHIERDLSTKLWNNLDDVVLKFSLEHKNSRVVLQ